MSRSSGNVSGDVPKFTPKPISQADQTALSSDAVKTAVSKLSTDVKSHASKDVIEQDKKDAFAKFQAAGGTCDLHNFAHEVSHSPGADKEALRQAFGHAERGPGGHRSAGGGPEGARKDDSSATRATIGSSIVNFS